VIRGQSASDLKTLAFSGSLKALCARIFYYILNEQRCRARIVFQIKKSGGLAMKQDAFFQTIIHHIGGEGNVARKRFDGEHLYVTVKDSGMADLEELNRLDGVSGMELNRNILSVTIQEDFLEDVTMAKDFKQLAQNIMTLAGAKENVTSVFHCMTRLRMTVKDVKKVDRKAINDLDGVLGVTYQGGQLQVIIGKDLLKVYEEVLKLGYSDGGAVDEKLDGDLKGEKISVGQAVIGYISAAVQPMVPALIGGGMIKVFLLLISKAYAPFADSSTYTLLSIVGNAVFYFMPILVAYGAAKKLGATPTYSMVVAGALVAPEWTAIVSAGDPVTMFGINVALKGYGSSLLPALLLAIVAYYVEKFLNKVIPGVFKPIFVGTLTMAATYAVSILALAPLGQLAGTYVTAAILWLYNIAGPITVALFTALFPYMVMTGMHMTLGAPMIQLLSETGFDPLFRPGMLLSNMAEGGASLGIAIKAKDKAIKSEALSVAVGCIFASVTEPAIYGFNLPLKKPMWAVSLGGAIGGVVAALLGAHNYEYGSSSLFALPIFEDTIVAMVIAIIVTIVASCVLTILFGFDEEILKKH
jgi:PTS system beta-glucosides-specific IIC component